MFMYKYVLDEEKSLIHVLDGDNEVGDVCYKEKDGLVVLSLVNLCVSNDKNHFENYFKVMSSITPQIESKFKESSKDIRKVVWGTNPQVAELDLYAEKIMTATKSTVKASRR